MNGRQTLLALILQGVIALAVIAAASVLAALNDLEPEAVVALFGAAIGLAGGASSNTLSGIRNSNKNSSQ